MKTIKLMAAALLSLLLTLLSACTHKDLLDRAPTGRITIRFDWSKAPEAAPKSMSVYLFPHNGSGVGVRYEFAGCEGGTIDVPLGTYDMVCINSDTRHITYTADQGRDNFIISTPDASVMDPMGAIGSRFDAPPRVSGTEDQRIVKEPEAIYRARVDNLDIPTPGTSRHVVMYPESPLSRYTVIIDDVPNLEYTAGTSAVLTTLADGLHMYHGVVTPRAATVPFGLGVPRTKAPQTLTGQFLSFGHMDTDHAAHILGVYVILANNEKKFYEIDVSDQVHDAPDPRNVYIYVHGLPIPKPITNGGGFHPQVDPWDPIYVPLPM